MYHLHPQKEYFHAYLEKPKIQLCPHSRILPYPIIRKMKCFYMTRNTTLLNYKQIRFRDIKYYSINTGNKKLTFQSTCYTIRTTQWTPTNKWFQKLRMKCTYFIKALPYEIDRNTYFTPYTTKKHINHHLIQICIGYTWLLHKHTHIFTRTTRLDIRSS